MSVDNQIRIGYYENWMFDQVIDLFVAQYHFDPDQRRTLFQQFYEAPFQASKCIRLVAMDGKTVCGFQSYFYWPYCYRGKTLQTFQSGGSLVSHHYRGRQIFARLLNFLAETSRSDRPEIEFLIGFPTPMSYGNFLRNQWANPLDLVWYVRPIHPFSLIRAYTPECSDWNFETLGESIEAYIPEDQITLSKDVAFETWRRDCRAGDTPCFYFHYRDSNGTIRFELKPNRRGRINECVIGDVVRASPDPALLRAGLRALLRAAKGHSFLTILSIALNGKSADQSLVEAVRECGFFKLKKSMPFIVKPIGDFPECTNPSRWNLLRTDTDTW